MSTINIPPRPSTLPTPSASKESCVKVDDQRIAIRDVSWEIYDLLSEAVGATQPIFLAFDGKDLEIMTKGRRHENYREILIRFVIFLTSELRIRCRGAGETTWKRPEIARGLEADLCYYLTPEKLAADAHAVSRGLTGVEHYPNPDMAIEIDLSFPEVDRPSIYAALQVAELWRFDGKEFVIENLQPDGTYHPVEIGRFLPVRPDEIRRWVIDEDFDGDELAWERRLRAWARAELSPRQNAG